MTSRNIAFWTLQSAAVGLFVAGGSWALMRWSAPTERDIVVVRTPWAAPDARETEDLAWAIRNEGIADAVSDARPDPYVPAEPIAAAPAAPAEPSKPTAEELPAEEAWAAPVTAMLKAKPARPAVPARSVLRMVSLGRPASGLSFGISAPPAAAAPEPPAAASASAALVPPEAEPAPARRALSPVRRAYVSAAPRPSAPPPASGLADQQGTEYGEADVLSD